MQEPPRPIESPSRSEAQNRGDVVETAVTSRAVELRELEGDSRCHLCIRTNRKCLVHPGDAACVPCSLINATSDCIFSRRVVREGRPDMFSWDELTGALPYRNGVQHHQRQGSFQRFEPPHRAVTYNPQYPAGPPQEFLNGDRPYPPSVPGASAHMTVVNGAPPPKRARTDLYDGQDVFAHRRTLTGQSQPPPEWHQRSELQLPEVRPSEGLLQQPLPYIKDEGQSRPISAPQERPHSTTLDLKPPSINHQGFKRKMEIEALNGSNDVSHVCSKCQAGFKTTAELKKHYARHEPQFFCTAPGCSRGRDGFTTKNDLDRHKKTMHKILGANDRFWKCFYADCAKSEKVWPRLDNFKAHIVRMHGQQYVAENVQRAEQWWDENKPRDDRLQLDSNAREILVPIEPKPDQSRFGVNHSLHESASDSNSARKRHLSAEGRHEAAQVRELGACLRCSLLKEKCDDAKVCHRCLTYAEKHRKGELICRRGNLADFLVCMIPCHDTLPPVLHDSPSWNVQTGESKVPLSTFSSLLEVSATRGSTYRALSRNTFTRALFQALDDVLFQYSRPQQWNVGDDYHAEIAAITQLRNICCVLLDTTRAIQRHKNSQENPHPAELQIQKTATDLRDWYQELEIWVFDWRTRVLDLHNSPWKKWNVFFTVCAMLVMERLTVLFTTTLAQSTPGYYESPGSKNIASAIKDECAETLCAILELKFTRQTPNQNQFTSLLLEDKHATTLPLRSSMAEIRETRGYDTWKWLYDKFGDDDRSPDHKANEDESMLEVDISRISNANGEKDGVTAVQEEIPAKEPEPNMKADEDEDNDDNTSNENENETENDEEMRDLESAGWGGKETLTVQISRETKSEDAMRSAGATAEEKIDVDGKARTDDSDDDLSSFHSGLTEKEAVELTRGHLARIEHVV